MEVDFDNGYKVRMLDLVILNAELNLSHVDITLFPGALRVSRVGCVGWCILSCVFISLFRIFELIMAFDALRLRNIIQLIGILGTAPQLTSKLPASHAGFVRSLPPRHDDICCCSSGTNEACIGYRSRLCRQLEFSGKFPPFSISTHPSTPTIRLAMAREVYGDESSHTSSLLRVSLECRGQ